MLTFTGALVVNPASLGFLVFFKNLTDDADFFLKKNDWPDIPDDYQVSEHYNYP